MHHYTTPPPLPTTASPGEARLPAPPAHPGGRAGTGSPHLHAFIGHAGGSGALLSADTEGSGAGARRPVATRGSRVMQRADLGGARRARTRTRS